MTHSNQWLQERADLLATVTEWQARAEKAEENLLKAEALLADAYGADTGMLDLACRAEAAEAKVARLNNALADLVSWFPEKPTIPKWELDAGAYGADDAINEARAALKAMENTDD